jgi:hypothetical protein
VQTPQQCRANGASQRAPAHLHKAAEERQGADGQHLHLVKLLARGVRRQNGLQGRVQRAGRGGGASERRVGPLPGGCRRQAACSLLPCPVRRGEAECQGRRALATTPRSNAGGRSDASPSVDRQAPTFASGWLPGAASAATSEARCCSSTLRDAAPRCSSSSASGGSAQPDCAASLASALTMRPRAASPGCLSTAIATSLGSSCMGAKGGCGGRVGTGAAVLVLLAVDGSGSGSPWP